MIRKIILIVLLVATVLWTAFIYSNSLKNGEVSDEQSAGVTEVVNKVASAVGIKEEIPHKTVRDMAHFTEFAILSVLIFCDVCVGFGRFFENHVPFIFILTGGVPLLCFGLAGIDELLQKLSAGRACQFTDALLDTLGSLCGALLSTAVYFICRAVIEKMAKAKAS